MEFWIGDRIRPGLIHGTQISAQVKTQPSCVSKVPRLQVLLGVGELDACVDVLETARQAVADRREGFFGR